MTADERAHFYRLINAAFGSLESSERIRFELMNMRHLQAVNQQKSIQQRLLAVLLTFVAAVPALYGLLPDELTRFRTIWLTAATVLAAVYVYIGWQQLKEEMDQARKVNIPPGYDVPPEKSPEFLVMQLSSYRTRWEMAQAVLRETPTDNLRALYLNVQQYWADKMRAMAPRLANLVEENRLSSDDYRTLLKWIPEELFEAHERPVTK